ncbi:MAG TPA: ABC transporter permease [Planctomycetota bacterium]|nr:ABC transporter permease [Planctomycetota bacterium]
MTPGLLLPSASLAHREFVRFFRERGRVIGALATPLVFWLFIGSGFGDSFRPPGAPSEANYRAYALPGASLLVVLFTAIFSTISIIEDRREGFLQAVLVSPAPRTAIVLGKLAGGSALATIQALLVLLLGSLAGAKVRAAGLLPAAGVLWIVAFGLTGLGFVGAWRADSVQGYHSFMNLLLMPLWILSGALFPPEGASGWIRVAMFADPLTYGLAALRRCLDPSDPAALGLPSTGLSLGVCVLFGLLACAASVFLVRRPGRGALA